MVFGIIMLFLDIIDIIMSNEVLEISVNVDEQFDVDFNLAQGLLGFILKVIGK